MKTRLVSLKSRLVVLCWCCGLLFVVVSSGAGSIRTATAQPQQRSSDHRNTNLRHRRRRRTKTNTTMTTLIPKSSRTTRQLIVGGRRAIRSEYPQSMVFLSDRLDNLSCGGTLISPTIVYVLLCYRM